MTTLDRYLRDVSARGVRVGEHPDYGGVGPYHMAGSMHYKGRAGDLNYGPAGKPSAKERRMLKWAARLADAAGLNVIYAHHRTHPIARTNNNHKNHLHVDDGHIAAYRPPFPGGNDSEYRKILAEKPVGKSRKPHRIRTIRRGSRGWRVRLLQRRLRGAGLYKGAIDKVFGPKTESAVRAFQRKRRQLTVDGVVGAHTWYHLGRGAKQGRGGRWRNEIAQRVVGLKGKNVDGKIGPQSDERIREVQRWLGVGVDGVYGKQTTRQLVKKG